MEQHAVVIVGAGPTGLVLAAELAIAKIDVVVLERRRDQTLEGSRGRGLQTRTIELFEQRGIAERFLAEGQKMPRIAFGPTTVDLSDLPSRHPYGLALAQERVEAILADWAAEVGVRFERNAEVVGFSEDAEGVDIELADHRRFRAKYVVGCDGGRSLIRKRAGIEFAGWDASTSFLIAEATFASEPPWGLRKDAKGTYAIGKLGDGLRAGIVLREEQVRSGDRPDIAELRDGLTTLYGSDFGIHSVTWLSRFSDMTRQAVAYRKGRVLLAGDAVHIHSPVGGQGLNLGVQDAMNLGWKLALVVNGISPERLLDTYHAERHPVAARILRMTMAFTALSRGDDRMDAVREVITDVMQLDGPRQRYGGILSGLDIHYDLGKGHPLLGRRMPDLDGRIYPLLHEARPLLVDFRVPPAFEVPSFVKLAHVAHEGPAPAVVLIRPDGYVAWASDGSGDGLLDSIANWT